jgi:DNA-directed RNA polymerase subunit RPC12/RpoP
MRETWTGSGVNSKDVYTYFDCADCKNTFMLDGLTDDGRHMAYAECPDCKTMLEKYVGGWEKD